MTKVPENGQKRVRKRVSTKHIEESAINKSRECGVDGPSWSVAGRQVWLTTLRSCPALRDTLTPEGPTTTQHRA